MKNLKTILIGIILCGLLITLVSASPQLYLDSYNASLVLNMHMNGTVGGTVFVDETGKSITVNGNPYTTNVQKFLGNASANFDGTGDWLETQSSSDFDFSSSDATISFKMYSSNLDNIITRGPLKIGTTGFYYPSANDIAIGISGVSELATTGDSLPSDTWNQIVIVRNQSTSTTKIYINGVEKASGTGNYFASGSATVRIGYGLTQEYIGYIDEVGTWKGKEISVSELYPQTVEIETVVPPVATFTATPTAGFAPLSVQFVETSYSSGTSWVWNATNVAGNNTPVTFNTTSGSPSYIFSEVGNYSIRLKSTNAGGSNISTQVTFVNTTIGLEVVANFTASNTTGIQPMIVHFTDVSTTRNATIDAWHWDYGDGNTSTVQNPDHTYDVPGTHSVNLTITNTSLSLVSTKIQNVTVYKLPNSDFSSFNTQGTAPFTTYLYDTSSNLNPGPYTYYWDLGDGNASTEQGVLHTWNVSGSFTVKHSVTDSVTTRWNNKTAYITVGTATIAPVASFYGGPQLGAPPLQVFFTDVSSNTPTSWFWEFGDGTNSTSQNPTKWYNQSGFFTVNLTATNTAGSNKTSQTNFVMVY